MEKKLDEAPSGQGTPCPFGHLCYDVDRQTLESVPCCPLQDVCDNGVIYSGEKEL